MKSLSNCKTVISEVIEEMLSSENDIFSKALLGALSDYVDSGKKLSDLSWFKGLNFELLEAAETVESKVA